MKLIIFFTFYLFFHVSVMNVYGCQCSELNTPLFIDYSRADAAFIGKVKKLIPISAKTTYDKYFNIEFEIQKNYKGINSSQKTILLTTHVGSASCGYEKGRNPKKNENWFIYFYNVDGEKNPYFGGNCSSTRKINSKAEIDDYEKDFLSKDIAAISGTIFDDIDFIFLKDLKVTVEGYNQKFTTQTNNDGFFFLPIRISGKYKVTIDFPYPIKNPRNVSSKDIVEINKFFDSNQKVIKTLISYDVEVKNNKPSYNEIYAYTKFLN